MNDFIFIPVTKRYELDSLRALIMNVETPDHVSNRVFHEMEIPPGTICRRHWKDSDNGEWNHGDWFIVVSRPKMDNNDIGEQIRVVYVDGEDKGNVDKQFLGGLGVQPPYRAVCEKHDFQIPERYVFNSRTARLIRYILRRL